MNDSPAAHQIIFYEQVVRNGRIWLKVDRGYNANGRANIRVGHWHNRILVAEIDDSIPFAWLIRA